MYYCILACFAVGCLFKSSARVDVQVQNCCSVSLTVDFPPRIITIAMNDISSVIVPDVKLVIYRDKLYMQNTSWNIEVHKDFVCLCFAKMNACCKISHSYVSITTLHDPEEWQFIFLSLVHAQTVVITFNISMTVCWKIIMRPRLIFAPE